MGLTQKRVDRERERGRHSDGDGLYLQVLSDENRSWLFRYERAGKERWMGLGSVRDWSLADARDRAHAARKLLANGVDPIDARKRERDTQRAQSTKHMTFEQCAIAYSDAHAESWRNAKHRAQFLSSLREYVFPIIGSLPVGTVETAHIIKVFEQKVGTGTFWKERPETARRVRQRVEAVIDWATVREFRTGENPARWKGHLSEVLPARSKKNVRHHAALPYDALPAFMVEVRRRESVSARALEVTVLCALRTQEVVNALWSEVDLKNRIWTIPPSRMKAQKEHRVPLSDRVIEILEALPREDSNDHIFIGGRAGCGLSNAAMMELLKGMRPGLTVHGFRSTFRDWCSERSNFPHEVAEMALAHTIPSAVERAYRRGDLYMKRTKLMESWSAYCRRMLNENSVVSAIRPAA